MRELELKQQREKLHQDLQKVKDHLASQPSTEVSSEIERRRVVAFLDGIGDSLRVLRDDPDFWLSLGPAFRVRYEDFQGDLAALRAAWWK